MMPAAHMRRLAAGAWLLALLGVRPSIASDPGDDPRVWMDRIQQEAAGPDERVEATMVLIDADGARRARATVIYQKDLAPGRTARRTEFSSPPEMAGSALLAVENLDRADDWWIYLPSYHTTRRIAAANRGETYMGTDFSYEDLTDIDLDAYRFSWVGEETIDGIECRLLEARTESEEERSGSVYGRRVYWVEKGRPVWRRALFYGRDGAPCKEATNDALVTSGGRLRWNVSEMRDLASGHRTRIEVSGRRLDPLPERLFTERSLRRPG
jgi:hypothetical protein